MGGLLTMGGGEGLGLAHSEGTARLRPHKSVCESVCERKRERLRLRMLYYAPLTHRVQKGCVCVGGQGVPELWKKPAQLEEQSGQGGLVVGRGHWTLPKLSGEWAPPHGQRAAGREG